ncbi:UNVERIFIED_CONTAM: hypothetical protein Sindi_3025900, partial [Sesamum indicum]
MDDEVASSMMGKRPGETASQYEKHILFVHPSGHSLTSSPLDGTNFLRRVNLIVTSWTWNSMSKDMVESFIHFNTSRGLWLAIKARYGWSNGPLIYQLQRELSSMVQQDLSLTAYLTNVTKLWNELNCLAPAPKCKCGHCTRGINKEIDELTSLTQLMQFLMGVYETFNNEGSQILMLDRLPSVEKAFSMLYTVEQQRAIQTSTKISTSNVAYQLTMKGTKRDDDKYVQKKKFIADKGNFLCKHCRRLGHGKDTYFQLHGICDWYISLNERRKNGRAFAANVDVKSERMQGTSMGNELIKLLQKANTPSNPITSYAKALHNSTRSLQ